jgi:ribosome biogenesis GTPase
MYRNVGYPVLEVSALKGTGLDAVKEMIAGKTVLFSGHSGVGKSALLNAISPGLGLKVGQISDWSLKGKHTTTFAEIFPVQISSNQAIKQSSNLIDTPGIKEFGMVDFNEQELSHFFPEMRAVLHDCHFANCTHRHEPQCAVKAAVEDGRISEERYRNYLNIIEDTNNTQ